MPALALFLVNRLQLVDRSFVAYLPGRPSLAFTGRIPGRRRQLRLGAALNMAIY
jgi:hypothetical protein